jgi:hypothetical protein
MTKRFSWTLNKLIVLLLTGGFFMFMMDLRYEHQDVLGDHWQAWIPIVFSAFMIIATIAGLWLWEKGGRKVLFWLFSASLIVGILGVWFHTKGKPLKSAVTILTAWRAPIVKHQRRKKTAPPAITTGKPAAPSKPKKEEETPPPPIAPLSFVGMGLFGMVACREWFVDSP